MGTCAECHLARHVRRRSPFTQHWNAWSWCCAAWTWQRHLLRVYSVRCFRTRFTCRSATVGQESWTTKIVVCRCCWRCVNGSNGARAAPSLPPYPRRGAAVSRTAPCWMGGVAGATAMHYDDATFDAFASMCGWPGCCSPTAEFQPNCRNPLPVAVDAGDKSLNASNTSCCACLMLTVRSGCTSC